MPGTYVPGWSRSVIFGVVLMKVKSFSWDEEVQKLIATHSLSGGVEEVAAGILSGEGMVEATLTLDQVPWGFGIRAGASAIVQYSLGALTPFVVPIMVLKTSGKSSVQELVTWSFSCCLNGNVGTYVYPS